MKPLAAVAPLNSAGICRTHPIRAHAGTGQHRPAHMSHLTGPLGLPPQGAEQQDLLPAEPKALEH